MDAARFTGGNHGDHMDGYDESNYSVGNDGDVTNNLTDRDLSQTTDEVGDPYVVLQVDGKDQAVLVSELVASAYVPNPDNLPNVRHIDGDRTNNFYKNLEWSYFPDGEAWSTKEIEKETEHAAKILFNKPLKDLSKEENRTIGNYMKDKLNTWVLQEIENPKTGKFFMSSFIVNPMGDVYDTKKKRFVNHKIDKYGNEYVNLGVGNIRVDHLVADNFIDLNMPVTYDMHVVHKDGNKHNNWVENLEVVR